MKFDVTIEKHYEVEFDPAILTDKFKADFAATMYRLDTAEEFLNYIAEACDLNGGWLGGDDFISGIGYAREFGISAKQVA